MTVTVLVTGASRGIGLAWCQQAAALGWAVLACARKPEQSPALAALAKQHTDRVELLALDVTSEPDIAALQVRIGGRALDVLVNNAGSFGPQGAPAGMVYQGLEAMDYDIWRQLLEVNLLAPFRLTVALRPNLLAGRRRQVVMMSSDLGSIANNSQGHSYAYRSSKAGLNMLTRGMAAEWPDLTLVAMAPGWCRTDLGGAQAILDPADSVRDQLATLERITPAESGSFVDRHGNPVPW